MFYKKRIEELERTVAALIEALEDNETIGCNSKRESLWGKFYDADNSNRKLQRRISKAFINIECNFRVLTYNSHKLSDLLDYLDLEYVNKPETKRLRKRKGK